MWLGGVPVWLWDALLKSRDPHLAGGGEKIIYHVVIIISRVMTGKKHIITYNNHDNVMIYHN